MKAFYFPLVLVIVHLGVAQSPMERLEESLRSEELTPEEEVRLTVLLAKEYAETNPDSALNITHFIAPTIRELGLDSLKGQFYVAISTAWSYLAQYDSSTAYSFKALKIGERYADTLTLIDAYNNLGIDFMFMEDDANAIGYFEQVKLLAAAYGDSLRLGHALNNIGMMKGYAEAYKAELDYYDQAAVIFKAIGEIEGLANTILNTGTTYTALGSFRVAESYYQQALKLFQEIDYSSGIQNTLQSASENALAAGELQKATKLAQEAIAIAKKYLKRR